MTRPNDPTMSHDSLDAAIAAYMLAVEGGEVPNRQELLDRHPEHADALRAFFADLDRMDRVASPLRLADGLEATGVDGSNGHGAPATIRYFGDYELLEEIARGGMGIVYKARQVSLNRLVALKMILAGSFASSRDVQRFRTEAESAANLDHPHIVPIYEVGDHEGQQYYSMKFVEGTSLAGHPRGEVRTEVAGLVDVARAVYHAHQRGILHRDLKPSNVLVDSRRNLLVTDFGLAKRLADTGRSFTETGQVLGTPKYMAPEQAAGRKDLTVTADVYSLGVILYERLTGQTPFTGDNVLTLLRQARESEPPRPSTIRPGLDRDLETVVLKCLEKEPGRRYQSAEAMADELDRWLRGEPIQARPVGQAERVWRWCKRNPAVSSLTAAVAASLIIGIIVSAYFAVQASRRALAERRERERAVEAEKKMEGLLVRGLARPLNLEGDENEPLSVPEAESLWELARLGDTDIGLRFLDEATRDPIATAQLGARSEPALIAAVGLDAERRRRAARLLAERLRDPALQLQSKVDVAFVSLDLEERASPETEEECGFVLRGLAGDFPEQREEWRQRLIAVSARIDPSIAARTLAQALGRETDARARQSSAMALSGVAGRMDPTRAAKTLAEALGRETDAYARSFLASALSEVTKRTDPTDAAETLAGALGRETKSHARSSLAWALSEVAGRMDPTEAARFLAEALGRETDASARQSLARALSGVAGRMDPADAARIRGQAVKILAEALGRETDAGTRRSLASALSDETGRMDPADAARICGQAAKILAEALGRETEARARRSLAIALSEVAGRMDATDAAPICEDVMRLSVKRLVKKAHAGGPWDDPTLVPGLLKYLDPARAKALTCEVVWGLGSKPSFNSFPLSELLDDISVAEIRRRAGLMAMMIGQAASGQFAWAGALAAEPFPCRLTTQELVELLKMPTCFGPARRVVLDHLENHYGRRFANHWAFVRFAKERNLELDFTSPPKRPDPKESLKRMLEALGEPAVER